MSTEIQCFETVLIFSGKLTEKEYEENVRMSRMIYNDTATRMNRYVRQWPSSFVANMLHFDVKEYLNVDDQKKESMPDLFPES